MSFLVFSDLQSAIDGSSGFFWVAIGFATLGLGRRSPFAIALGCCAVTLGASYVFVNLDATTADANAILQPASWAAFAVSGVWLVALLTKGAPRRRVFLALAGLATTIVLLSLRFSARSFLESLGFSGGVLPAELNIGAQTIATTVGVLVAAACALRYRDEARAGRPRADFALLALAMGAWWMFGLGPSWYAYPASWTAADLTAAAFAIGAACTWLAATSEGAGSRAARDTSLGLFGFILVGAAAPLLALALGAVPGSTDDHGLNGIMRTIGAALFCIGIFRFGLLGVKLPRFAVKRGALASLALASFIIIAQIGQNFLQAQYGVLLGGIVAGAFLVFAAPIQRVLEGRSASRPPGRDGARREEIYRNAVRVALRDKVVTREEELHLARVAEELGIGAGRAHEILIEVERASDVTPG